MNLIVNKPAYKIKKCTNSDANQILKLETENSATPYTLKIIQTMLGDSDTVFLKAVFGRIILGYIAIKIILDQAEIHIIAVQNEYRQKGIGKDLLNSAISDAKTRGANRFFLEVNENNAAAIKLYQSNGFLKQSMRKNYYGKESALVLALDLS